MSKIHRDHPNPNPQCPGVHYNSTTNICVIPRHHQILLVISAVSSKCQISLSHELFNKQYQKNLLYKFYYLSLDCLIYQTVWSASLPSLWFFLSSLFDIRLSHWPALSIPLVSPCPKIEAENWGLTVSASLADNRDFTGNFTWFSISSGGVSNRTHPNIGPVLPNRETQALKSNPSIQGDSVRVSSILRSLCHTED